MPLIWIATGLLFTLLSACAEGRWAQTGKSDLHTQEDWEQCKAEVLSGAEHGKQTMAGGISLSGCMHSKGYAYTEEPSRPPVPSQR